jgi:hypothetical protein
MLRELIALEEPWCWFDPARDGCQQEQARSSSGKWCSLILLGC